MSVRCQVRYKIEECHTAGRVLKWCEDTDDGEVRDVIVGMGTQELCVEERCSMYVCLKGICPYTSASKHHQYPQLNREHSSRARWSRNDLRQRRLERSHEQENRNRINAKQVEDPKYL